ncbi:hypothetical protein GCM10010345_27850 [Streptomyces canarius]|uniref:Uncharacterized protein n=1 Tax=Streptomyces canarius TaxID=285453 RepID=A0ABQ3CKF5_9ACTN|nr:hypothetical protein GCM10010345_27850 [Streptomyces canarius]
MVVRQSAGGGPAGLVVHRLGGTAERGRVPLERATGLPGVIERLASTVGLVAGGSLVALLGP